MRLKPKRNGNANVESTLYLAAGAGESLKTSSAGSVTKKAGHVQADRRLSIDCSPRQWFCSWVNASSLVWKVALQPGLLHLYGAGFTSKGFTNSRVIANRRTFAQYRASSFVPPAAAMGMTPK